MSMNTDMEWKGDVEIELKEVRSLPKEKIVAKPAQKKETQTGSKKKEVEKKKVEKHSEEQAEALKEAAKGGKPYCKKCEEAKKKLQEEEEAELEESTQAGSLKEAAKDGKPFCEKCAEAQKKLDVANAKNKESVKKGA